MTFGPPNHLALFDPRALSGLVYPGTPSSYSDSESESFLHAKVSSPISRLQDRHVKCERNLGFNIDWATTFVVDHINKKADAAETFRNVRIKAAALEGEGFTQAIPYRIFNKLDETLFAGHLKNAVYLDARSLNSDVSGATYNPNWCPVTGVQRISIILNIDVLEYARARDIIAILIHHMIHAYFLVACGPQKEDEVEYGRLGHGLHFCKILSTIKKLSAAHGKELSPLGAGHNLTDFQTYGEAWHRPRRRHSSSSSCDQKDKEERYCSHCPPNACDLPPSEIDKWYDKTIKPLSSQPCKALRSATVHIYNDCRHELELKPRARLPPSSKTVEFILKDKPILVEKKNLETQRSVLLAFEKSSSRFLKIEKEVSEATFLRFLEFTHTSTYRPDPTNHGMHTRKGAPLIRNSSRTASTPILSDIHVLTLATLHSFTELQSYALKRLDTYNIISEDPIDVLEAIYSGSEPDTKLKDWVRRFLVASGPGDVPNLLKLESEQGVWRGRLHEVMERYGALENEVGKAWGEVRRGEWGGRGYGVGVGVGAGCGNVLTTGGGGYQMAPFQQQQRQLLLGSAGVSGTTSGGLDALALTGAYGNPLINALSNLYGNQHLIGNGAASGYDIQRERRELERERRQVERERDRLKETAAQVQAAAVLESMMGRGMVMRGWVENEFV